VPADRPPRCDVRHGAPPRGGAGTTTDSGVRAIAADRPRTAALTHDDDEPGAPPAPAARLRGPARWRRAVPARAPRGL